MTHKTTIAALIGWTTAFGCSGSAPPPQTPARSTPQSGSSLPAPAAAAPSTPEVDVALPSEDSNPFAHARFAIDPGYVREIESAVRESPANASAWRRAEQYPTAIWLSSIASVGTISKTLDDAAAQERKAGEPVVTVFAIYDLPERDCNAVASNGELSLANGGETRYKTEFIDGIATIFRAHAGQRIVAIVEPDSLPNLATNLDTPRCAAAERVYRQSVAYAVKTLAMPNVSLYLDAAHAGWLGWSGNRAKMAKIVSDVLALAGGPDKVRGFATNVSNYDTLRGGDLAKLQPSDPCPDELTYVKLFAASLAEVGITGKGFVIDTSRNGRSGIRTDSGSWCNVRGAGLGERPRASPAPYVDAYYWVKPPGESDGASDPSMPGFDEHCGSRSPDSAAGAPHAGQWFSTYFGDLVKNASPPL